ncbi:alpha-amylase/4-alpha-glucanotransferase domain-containing protein [Paludisphaera rhizosphaerae]|uniref:alpha-amylase/4-alpha-glucanotransferase domain-containing protein n=1 Tax=Paludisphaera rhizosphaerae TaxID=2711216 RepID=UPI0013EBA48F|nr:alpha-amylase/4-alpha-glucanotransferase domain-containing protein [Paludisphaera rhizosphaerae]
MSNLRLILALHNHQPVGNFEAVFESAYRDSYLPFLEVLERYPEIAFCLHTSGPLLEWLVDQKPDYVARVKAMVEAGRVEILGGGYFEPIMTMIPQVDRVGQIRTYSSYLEEVFGAKVRGMWTPERVWEQHMVSAVAEAGIEYTVLDDFHFERAGVAGDDLFGFYLTEDEGRLLKIFPGSETLRYTIPFQEPHATYEFLRGVASRKPGATVVFADDGEKFGSWPETYNHVYTRGWMTRFCDMIVGNRDWLSSTTLGRTVDATLPLGKVYISDASYREMTEWALQPDQKAAYDQAARMVRQHDRATDLKPFLRAGGFWRNFKARYPESDEMYARMLGLSRRLAEVAARPDVDPDYIEAARRELYRGQCNCPYWHGAFGGLYLPHLRGAIYQALIACHDALDEAEGKTGPRVSLEVGDFNLDARQEARIENDRLIAFIRPAQGGHIYELDVRKAGVNVLGTLERRPEAYHQTILDVIRARGSAEHDADRAGVEDKVVLKQDDLDDLLIYDDHPRKALVDHFYPLDATLDDLAACRALERGDFVAGAYLARVRREDGKVALVMERPGLADGRPIKVRKTIEAVAGSPTLDVKYEIEEIPADACLHFAVEMNLAGMAGRADDRYYSTPSGERLGTLDSRVDRPHMEGLSLTDEWLDLAVGLSWSRPGGVWCFPIETVSQSEGGFEGVYQSSAVIPHWHVVGDESGRWEVTIRLSFDAFRPTAPPVVEPQRRASFAEV